MSNVIGTVAEMLRYPVKSMAGEHPLQLEVDWQGIEGDRQYAFYRLANRSRFPWLTARELPDLVRFTASYRGAAHPRKAPVDVLTPEGAHVDLYDDALLRRFEAAAGEGLGLIQLGRGAYDAMPIALLSEATIRTLGEEHGSALDRRRFRANLIISSTVRESHWVGARLRFGDRPDSAELLVADPIERCSVVTIDPDSGTRQPRVMATVAQRFDNRIGVYASTARPGTIHLDDEIALID